jgi:outer membrane protein assembly factor BamB
MLIDYVCGYERDARTSGEVRQRQLKIGVKEVDNKCNYYSVFLVKIIKIQENYNQIMKAISTSMIQVKNLNNGRIIILENYYKFIGESNLYCIDKKSQQVIWFSELPMPNDLYSNKFSINNSEITISSYNGITVKIDCNTGKIKDEIFSR